MTLDASRLQPVISPSPEAAPFWEAAAQHRLDLPFCSACNAAFFYPRPLCPTCGSRDVEWVTSRGAGTLHSFCVQYRSAVPGLTDAAPFVTALVDLDEGPRLTSFLVGVPAEPEQISCGLRVAVEFIDRDAGPTLVAFRPAPAT
jgi:uncharacterized protein